jgi:hypothetical protein
VHADQSIGDNYVAAVIDMYGISPEDLEEHAANERFKCYQRFGAIIPAGGHAEVTPRIAQARRAAQRRRSQERLPRYCEIHHLQLTVTGLCALCDD